MLGCGALGPGDLSQLDLETLDNISAHVQPLMALNCSECAYLAVDSVVSQGTIWIDCKGFHCSQRSFASVWDGYHAMTRNGDFDLEVRHS